MTTYTVRDPDTLLPITGHTTLDAATDSLETERAAFLLNPPPQRTELELVVTADECTDSPGVVLVHYSASHHR